MRGIQRAMCAEYRSVTQLTALQLVSAIKVNTWYVASIIMCMQPSKHTKETSDA